MTTTTSGTYLSYLEVCMLQYTHGKEPIPRYTMTTHAVLKAPYSKESVTPSPQNIYLLWYSYSFGEKFQTETKKDRC